jgi:hypothetical protein
VGFILTFDENLQHAKTPDACWGALEMFAATVVETRLFTVMTVDMQLLLARRAYSNMPADYPVSGTKPITIDRWFDVVHRQKKIFVANTIADIAKVFPDHEKIQSLSCGSVVNLPVIVADDLVATINLLHAEHFYTPQRVQHIAEHLTGPAQQAYARALALA